ncbi:MAG: oxaloacetate decarboxylase subunit alpha [Dethiobacteria bacterium]|nr:oxaloacetate decarboxylase subunit alpha [Bacillota bacterium]
MTEVKKILITDTTLRDAHQSLMATRMRTEDMLPIAEKMDNVGFYSLEVWGGATFDTCMRFLDEDPWERLRKLRQRIKKTKLQMLLRGQNLLGYRHYADDVVENFIAKVIANGIDIIRIFDALNDIRNMEKAMFYTKREGGHVQATISYTISPLHDNNHFIEMGKRLEEMGADSICIKDMAGLLSPYNVYILIKELKDKISIPLQLHCHCTSGMAPLAYLKAIEAGVDVLDTATSSLAMGTSQPPTDSIVASLKGTPYDTGLDLEQLSEISDYFKEVRKKYDIPLEAALGVDTNVLSYQIPGGMISNLAAQLAQQNASHLLAETLKEVPRVRADLGYPPLVTPSSQLVGSQAVVNVLLGERYKMVSTEIKNYIRGLYGKPPGEINPELREKILQGSEPVTCRPADLLEPQMEKARSEIEEYMEKEEDLLSYILFPQVALNFFKRRQGLIPELKEEEEKKAEEVKVKSNLDLSAIYRVDSSLLSDEDDDEEVWDIVYPT